MTANNETTRDRLSTADFAGAAEQHSETVTAVPDGSQKMSADNQPIQRRTDDRAEPTPLFTGSDGENFHRRWSDIQASFVDEPRGAVEQADSLVAEVMQHLATTFADERRALEQQWARGGDADTEDLRLALRRYRSFFDRLLAM
jgi:hypothetical protein